MPTTRGVSRAGSLPLVAGELALDFCNTTSGRGTDERVEHLIEPPHLVAWCRHAGVLDAEREEILARRCTDATFAQALLARALGLREAIHRLDATLAAQRPPDQADLDAVAATHAACLAEGRFAMQGGHFGWTWDVAEAPAEAVLGPIATSAMTVVTQVDHARLKQCDGHHCGWLFLDTTKNNKRRWCEMEVCGNRAKQKRRRGRIVSGSATVG